MTVEEKRHMDEQQDHYHTDPTLPWETRLANLLTKVPIPPSWPPPSTDVLQHQASAVVDIAEKIVTLGGSRSRWCVRDYVRSLVSKPSRGKQWVIEELVNIVSSSRVAERLWVLWCSHHSLVSIDLVGLAHVHAFSLAILPYMRGEEGEGWGVNSLEGISEPNQSWLWTWENIFNVQGTIGVTGAGGWGIGKEWSGPLAENFLGAKSDASQVLASSAATIWLVQKGEQSPKLSGSKMATMSELYPDKMVIFGIPKGETQWEKWC